MRTTIQNFHGVPTLFVNGEPQAAMSYMTCADPKARYRDFHEAGYRLFSCSIHFGDRPVNAMNRARAMRHGIFEIKGEEHFEHFDRTIEQILREAPDAWIFPRLNVSPPVWWEEEHPEACNDVGFEGGPRRFSPASRVWLDAAKKALRRFFAHVRETPFEENLIGWQIAGGNTEEWLATNLQGSQSAASRAAFAAESPDDQSPEAYRHFLSEVNARAVCELAAEVKALTEHRLVVGSFYGYLFETPFWSSLHHALARVLRSPDIDFICSPSSYSERLKPEMGWPPMTVIDSLKFHGKVYFHEFDTRTHLTTLFRDSLPEVCPPDAYIDEVWQPLASEQDSLNALRMNFGQQMAFGTASWWFDMWGGWFASPVIMGELARYLAEARRALADPDRASVAEFAAFIDERSYAQQVEPLECAAAPHLARIACQQSGVPCDFYEASDFAEAAPRYRAVAFIVPAPTPAICAAQEWCDKQGMPWLEFTNETIRIQGQAPIQLPPINDFADNASLEAATAITRQFCQSHGLHCYNESGDAVYVSRNWITLHAAATGEQRLKLPERRTITPLFPAGEPWTGDAITLHLPCGGTAVFRLDG